MPIAAVLDASCDLTEAVQEDFIIATVVFIVPGAKSRDPGMKERTHVHHVVLLVNDFQ